MFTQRLLWRAWGGAVARCRNHERAPNILGSADVGARVGFIFKVRKGPAKANSRRLGLAANNLAAWPTSKLTASPQSKFTPW